MAVPGVTLKAPRAAAIAGILFSLLLIVSVLLVRVSVPADPREAGAWLTTRAPTVALAAGDVFVIETPGGGGFGKVGG